MREKVGRIDGDEGGVEERGEGGGTGENIGEDFPRAW